MATYWAFSLVDVCVSAITFFGGKIGDSPVFMYGFYGWLPHWCYGALGRRGRGAETWDTSRAPALTCVFPFLDLWPVRACNMSPLNWLGSWRSPPFCGV